MMLLSDMWRRFLYLFLVPPVKSRAVLLLRERENELLDARLSLSAYRQRVRALEEQVRELRRAAEDVSTGAEVIRMPLKGRRT